MTLYHEEIVTAASVYGIDARVLEAQVLVESGGHTYAYRYEPNFWAKYMANQPAYHGLLPERVSASYGLMQVMFVVAQEVGYQEPDPEHLFVPKMGLRFGCLKMQQLLAWSQGDVVQALAAYNGGKAGNTRAPFRNQFYADKVFALVNSTKGLL